ncbi:hypothetical protein GCM10027294_08320 [Marinactinospora endophytica]
MNGQAVSAARLPLYALALARRYWAPLLCVHTVGVFLHWAVLRGMVLLERVDPVAALAGLSVAVLTTLTATIVMLHLLVPGLPTLQAELLARRARGVRSATLAERERRVVDAIATAVLPFLLLYSAWGMFAEEYRRYAVELINHSGIQAYTDQLQIDALGPPLVAALVCLAGRVVVERLYHRGGAPGLGVLTALFEANWMFFAVFSVVRLTDQARQWVASRAVVAELHDAAADLVALAGDLTGLPLGAACAALFALVSGGWEQLKDAVLEPLMWLAIVAVIFGAEIDRAEAVLRGDARAARVRAATRRLPRPLRGVAGITSRDLREKYAPFLNAIRFVLRVGPVFFLTLCLCHVLLEAAEGWLRRGVHLVVGPHDFLGWWWQWLEPLAFATGALHEVLRVCLLAAAFELALRALAGHSVGRRVRPAPAG